MNSDIREGTRSIEHLGEDAIQELDFYFISRVCQWDALRKGMMGSDLYFNLDKFQ